MNIAIDIDEVVVEFIRGYIRILEKNGIKVEYDKTHSYIFWESYPLTREQAIKFADEFFDSEFFENIELVAGAKEAIIQLEKKNELFFLTSRPLSIKDKTQRFMEKHFPNSNITLVFSGDFHKDNGKTKAEICRELKIPVIIEDNKNYALECAKSGVKAFLIAKPWNVDAENHENIIKVNSWGEIMNNLK